MSTYLQNFVVIKHSDSYKGAGFMSDVHWIADVVQSMRQQVNIGQCDTTIYGYLDFVTKCSSIFPKVSPGCNCINMYGGVHWYWVLYQILHMHIP